MINIYMLRYAIPSVFPHCFFFDISLDRCGTTQCRLPPVSLEVGPADAVHTEGTVRRLQGRRKWIVGRWPHQSRLASRHPSLRRRLRQAQVERARGEAAQFAIDVRMARPARGHAPTARESSVTAQPLGTNM